MNERWYDFEPTANCFQQMGTIRPVLLFVPLIIRYPTPTLNLYGSTACGAHIMTVLRFWHVMK